jgi:hypothetical protein
VKSGFYWHHGIVSLVNHLGQATLVIHCSKQSGSFVIQESSFENFCGGSKSASLVQGPQGDPNEVVARAKANIGLPPDYDLFGRNCEHFATWYRFIVTIAQTCMSMTGV